MKGVDVKSSVVDGGSDSAGGGAVTMQLPSCATLQLDFQGSSNEEKTILTTCEGSIYRDLCIWRGMEMIHAVLLGR